MKLRGSVPVPENALSADAKQNPFRFEGFYYDTGLKNYDMQARQYKPQIGRYLTQDRYEDAAGDLALQSDPLTQNRYAFAGGNPVNNIEYDGHCGALLPAMGPTFGGTCKKPRGGVGGDTKANGGKRRDGKSGPPLKVDSPRLANPRPRPRVVLGKQRIAVPLGLERKVARHLNTEFCDYDGSSACSGKENKWNEALLTIAIVKGLDIQELPLKRGSTDTGLTDPFNLGTAGLTGALAKVAVKQFSRSLGFGAVAKAGRGGAGPVRIGQAGEDAVRAAYDIGPRRTVVVNGRTRIFDGLTDEAVSEVKTSLGFRTRASFATTPTTRQRRDCAWMSM